jgi:tripartite-type tricarboxylate transporter receptor subunit TctC
MFTRFGWWMCLMVLCIAHSGAHAQEWPSKPIRLVVPASAGGAGDIIARMIGEKLGNALGRPVVTEPRPGAGGNVAGEVVARSAPDGYTLLLVEPGLMAINPTLYAKVSFNPLTDFEPIGLVAVFPFVVVVNPKLPANTLEELIQLARSQPSAISYGSPGIGTPQHLGAEMFAKMTGAKLQHIPYKGGAPATVDLLGGQIELGFIGLPPLLAHMRENRLRGLAVSTSKRFPGLPQLPTVAEAGVPGFDASVWIGIAAPAKTPKPIIARIKAELDRILASEDVREKLLTLGADVATSESPEQFAAFARSEHAKWSELVKSSGAKVE